VVAPRSGSLRLSFFPSARRIRHGMPLPGTFVPDLDPGLHFCLAGGT